MASQNQAEGAFTIPEGYRFFCSCPSYFAMDLVGTNLTMNGIEAVWNYPEQFDHSEQAAELPSLYVRADQAARAGEVLASLDLTDFTDHHGI